MKRAVAEVGDGEVQALARAIAREQGHDPDLLVSPGSAPQLITPIGNYHLAAQVSFPLWCLFRPLAESALRHACELVDARLERVR